MEKEEEIIVDGATDWEAEEDVWSVEVEKGIWKQFAWIEYNQTEVDAYSCTVVSTFTALSNLTWKTVDYALMRETLAKMEKAGKFRKGFWASLKNGVEYSVMEWNAKFGTNYEAKLITLSPSSIIEGLKHSPVVTGVYYGKNFISDTQDDAWINGAIADTKGSQWHAIPIVKINTMDDVLIKMCLNYKDRLEKNVVGVDFTKYRSLFFNTGYYFVKNGKA